MIPLSSRALHNVGDEMELEQAPYTTTYVSGIGRGASAKPQGVYQVLRVPLVLPVKSLAYRRVPSRTHSRTTKTSNSENGRVPSRTSVQFCRWIS